MKPDGDTSVEQPNPTPTNTRSTMYDLHHIPIALKVTDNEFSIRPAMAYGIHRSTLRKF